MALPRFVDYSLRFIAPVSLGLAVYYHYQSVQERAPTYYIGPARARIVDTSIPAPPQLQILYKGKDLNANVSAAIVYFWNDGKLPIKAEDVLEPVKVELEPGCEILDSRILKMSRSVTNLARGKSARHQRMCYLCRSEFSSETTALRSKSYTLENPTADLDNRNNCRRRSAERGIGGQQTRKP